MWVDRDWRLQILRYYRQLVSLVSPLAIPFQLGTSFSVSRISKLPISSSIIDWNRTENGSIFLCCRNGSKLNFLPLLAFLWWRARKGEQSDPKKITAPMSAWLGMIGFLLNTSFRAWPCVIDRSQMPRLAAEQTEAIIDAVSWSINWISTLWLLFHRWAYDPSRRIYTPKLVYIVVRIATII